MDGERPGGDPPGDWSENQITQESLGLVVWCVHHSDFNDPQNKRRWRRLNSRCRKIASLMDLKFRTENVIRAFADIWQMPVNEIKKLG